MMKTWIGPACTGSGSGFIDESATPKRVSISSAMVVRLCERKIYTANSAQCTQRPGGEWFKVVVGGGAWGRAHASKAGRRRRVWWRMPKGRAAFLHAVATS